MPSTRKQKAKERRSRQLAIMSDVENVDVMLGSYSRDDENNASEDGMNLDLESNRLQQSSNVIGEDFRSLLNTNSRENSQVTIETTRIISDEVSGGPKVQRATSQPKVDRIHHKGPKVQWATTEHRSRKFAGNDGESP